MSEHPHKNIIATAGGQFCLECGQLVQKAVSNNKDSQTEKMPAVKPGIVGHAAVRIDPLPMPAGLGSAEVLPAKAPAIAAQVALKRQAL